MTDFDSIWRTQDEIRTVVLRQGISTYHFLLYPLPDIFIMSLKQLKKSHSMFLLAMTEQIKDCFNRDIHAFSQEYCFY